MPDRVSIRDLARIAGVSRTTVSLALRGSHEVSAATRQRILALARKHDYRSHPAVNALMQQVGRGVRVHDEEVIAFVRCGADPDERAAGPLELLGGARDEAHRLGYRVEIFWAGYKGAAARPLGRVLYNRGIRGIIWSPMPYPHPPLVFPWEHFAPIACTLSAAVPRLPTVSIHHSKGMALVLEELTRRGAVRIGFLAEQIEDSRQDFGWLSGIDIYRHRGGTAEVFPRLAPNLLDEKTIRSWMKRLRLDALVLTQNFFDHTASWAGTVPRISLDVPTKDLGRVAGLYQDTSQLGRHAVRSLAIRLANGILGLPEQAFSVVSHASFVEGRTLRGLKNSQGA